MPILINSPCSNFALFRLSTLEWVRCVSNKATLWSNICDKMIQLWRIDILKIKIMFVSSSETRGPSACQARKRSYSGWEAPSKKVTYLCSAHQNGWIFGKVPNYFNFEPFPLIQTWSLKPSRFDVKIVYFAYQEGYCINILMMRSHRLESILQSILQFIEWCFLLLHCIATLLLLSTGWHHQ